MIILGLTGSFGTGKTFVASIFKALGAKIIDADKIARKAIKKGSTTYKRIVDAFGDDILDEGRNINRRRLAGIVFDNKNNLNRLNEIVHPEVIREIKERIEGARSKDIVIIDAPLLIEANLANVVDKLIVVKSSMSNQIDRCMSKFGISEEDILKRINSQIPLERKARMADFVIDNDGTKAETKKQVRKIWRKALWR